MPTRIFIIRIVMSCLLFLAGKTVCAQKIMLSTEAGDLFVLDMATCTAEKQVYADGWGIGPLSMYRSTYYFFSTIDGELYAVTGNPANRVKSKIAQAGYLPMIGNIMSMSVDKTGRIYWIGDPDNHLRTYFPEAFNGWTSGRYWLKTPGDLVFYKDQLYASTDVGIAIVNIGRPQVSEDLVISTTRVFAGLVNVVTTCSGENKVYGIENIGNTSRLVEIDIDNKQILGTYCSFDLGSKVSDACSSNETGEPSFIGINSIGSKRPCFPDSTYEVKINAYTPAGDSGLTYTFRKGTETMGPFKPVNGSFTFNPQTTTGLWNLNIKSGLGCTRDTTVTIYPQGKITAVPDIRPDTCTLNNGGITINIAEGRAPFGFKLDALVPQASPVFTGLSQGTYKMKVTDSTDCATEFVFTINPYTPRSLITGIAITAATTCSPVGEIKINYPPSIDAPTARLDNDVFEVKSVFSNVPAGTHRLQVKKGSCSFDTTVIIPISTVRPVIDTILNHNPCVGNGNIRLVISGADAPYRFEVSGTLYNSGAITANLPSGNYPATVYNAAKCIVDSIRFVIPAKTDCDTIQAIFIPTAFTPNGDGKNDILKPVKNPAGKVVHFIFRVYNRLGQMLFESTSPGKGWDGRYSGTPQPPAVYVWVFQGTESDGKVVNYTGTTLLIR